MGRRPRQHAGGFTLVETLAAGMILALAATVLSLAVRQSLRSLRVSRDLQQAAELCDRVLTKIDILGAAQMLDDGYTSGQFEIPRELFSWVAEITPMDVGDLYDVIVTIRWETAFENRSVEMQTLLRDSSEDGPSLLHWEDL